MMTLPGYRPYATAPPGRTGPGVIALVLGLVALPLSLLCGFGVLPALGGLGIGAYALANGRGRTQAIIGLVASVIALVLAALVITWFLGKAAKCGDTHRFPDHAARVGCVEREFPLVQHKADY